MGLSIHGTDKPTVHVQSLPSHPLVARYAVVARAVARAAVARVAVARAEARAAVRSVVARAAARAAVRAAVRALEARKKVLAYSIHPVMAPPLRSSLSESAVDEGDPSVGSEVLEPSLREVPLSRNVCLAAAHARTQPAQQNRRQPSSSGRHVCSR